MKRWIPDQVYPDEAYAAERCAQLRAWTDAGPDPRTQPYVLAIEHDGVLVGHVGLSAARGSVEIGYAIEERENGKGYATEAVAAMAAWGLALPLPEVLGIVGHDNVASRRVLEKAGFVWNNADERGVVYRFA